jgi:transcriptional regulator of arginine metabolism
MSPDAAAENAANSESAAGTIRLSKAQRQYRIQTILEDNAVTNQVQLVELLAHNGIAVNQATVSRDLEEMGAIKVRIPGGESAYAIPELPKDQHTTTDHLRRVMGEWVVEISVSAPIIILRTPPGCAHVVGSALDRSGFEGVLGTVAGDDTMLVVAAPSPGADAVAEALAALAGMPVVRTNSQ